MAEPSAPSDLASRIAGLLETVATRIRSMTVDRVATAVTWTAMGIVLTILAFLVVLWSLVAGFRALGTLIGQELAYAIVGAVLGVAGVILWSMRLPRSGKVRE
jgi:hypothetical protein